MHRTHGSKIDESIVDDGDDVSTNFDSTISTSSFHTWCCFKGGTKPKFLLILMRLFVGQLASQLASSHTLDDVAVTGFGSTSRHIQTTVNEGIQPMLQPIRKADWASEFSNPLLRPFPCSGAAVHACRPVQEQIWICCQVTTSTVTVLAKATAHLHQTVQKAWSHRMYFAQRILYLACPTTTPSNHVMQVRSIWYPEDQALCLPLCDAIMCCLLEEKLFPEWEQSFDNFNYTWILNQNNDETDVDEVNLQRVVHLKHLSKIGVDAVACDNVGLSGSSPMMWDRHILSHCIDSIT